MIHNLLDNGFDKKKFFMGSALFVIIILIILINYFRSRPLNDYIILSESLILGKENGKWVQIDEIDDNILSKKYTIIGSFGTKKNVSIKYAEDMNEFFYMNDKYQDLNVKHPYVSFTDKYNVKPAQYDVLDYESSDDEFIRKATNKDISQFVDSIFKSKYDLDGDGKEEIIYTLTNAGLDNKGKSYSTIFMVSDGNYIGKLDKDTNKPYLVRNISDIDNDGKYEVIVSKGDIDFSTFDSDYQIYKFDRGNIKKIMD